MGRPKPGTTPGSTEHIGLALWAAAEDWRRRLTVAMAARDVDWFGEARATLIPHISAEGVRMANLSHRSGITRQAVHQFILALEADGVVVRESDPDDARGRVVRYTEEGLAILRKSDTAKREIEMEYAAKLGEQEYMALLAALKTLPIPDNGTASAT